MGRDGVTILPRPAKKITTAKNNRPVPALEKKKKHRPVPSRPVPSRPPPPKATPSRLGKKTPPRLASEKKKRPVPLRKNPPASSRLEKKTKPPRPAKNSKIHRPEGVCVCVFSSHPFWTSSSLDVPAGVTQEEGHTGFLIHLPSAVRALIFVARRIQPFLSLVDREVEFCVLTN